MPTKVVKGKTNKRVQRVKKSKKTKKSNKNYKKNSKRVHQKGGATGKAPARPPGPKPGPKPGNSSYSSLKNYVVPTTSGNIYNSDSLQVQPRVNTNTQRYGNSGASYVDPHGKLVYSSIENSRTQYAVPLSVSDNSGSDNSGSENDNYETVGPPVSRIRKPSVVRQGFEIPMNQSQR